MSGQARRRGVESEEAVTLVLDDAEIEAQIRKIQAHLTETVWLVAETYGADRTCAACRRVVHALDARDTGYVCVKHCGRKS